MAILEVVDISKRFALDKFHYEIIARADCAAVKAAHNIRVIQLFQEIGFTHEPLNKVGVASAVRV